MSRLPIDTLKESFLQRLPQTHLIVEAETGSGKSTRLPMWASEQGRVLVIEPRRIACTSLAQFLSQERGEKLGESVGYAIKLENVYSDQSQVVFVTPGVALKWFAENKLKAFDIVLVDEFHERRWDTDLLVAMLKASQSHRLVITSATIEGEKLARYVGADRLHASGRHFDVTVEHRAVDSHHLPQLKNIEQRVHQEVASQLLTDGADILVFLPGRKEIAQCAATLKSFPQLLIVPLHASVSDEQRLLALTKQPQRKVVLATNVAETSLTIPNISTVIDSGLERRTVQRNGRSTLMLSHISKASAKQRMGRAGRVMQGECIRLYGKHAALEAATPPELQREGLTEPMLAAATCGYKLQDLDWLDTIPEKSLEAASLVLRDMGAIDEDGTVTEHGTKLSPLPIDALYADLVTRSEPKAVKEAMVDLAAALAVPASLYTLSSNADNVEALLREEPFGCDASILIRLVRGDDLPGVSVDQEAVKEARGLAAQMRELFELPSLCVASRFERHTLAEEIARLHPELLFVRRVKRREAFGNGVMEVLPARNSRVTDKHEAMLVLDTHSLPGRGVKQTLNLATVVMPVPLSLFAALEIGEWIQGESTVENGTAYSALELVYAGRSVMSKRVEVQGELALKPILDSVLSGEIFPGFAEKLQQQIQHWRLYVELGLADVECHQDLDFERWFCEQLTMLELESIEDLALFSEEDFQFEGIPYWEYQEFAEKYPLRLALGDLNVSVEYMPKRKLVYVVYENGLRKKDPKRWELPVWKGWRIQYKKASRIVDIK
ncbi:ATP-dependent RNA helicase [Vibrio sp. SCSIO 43135]|uniref:helicase-related protein n=1 Tax=Vibrio sp. SCSIO 43135 TaxID=2819096 RepID=UPI002075AF98|nr:helicase-related protein [Vibrio sp. SCSIO 43135]USD42227.1 ATP-dependent RNA helicase [Vibrio sp. SCSIO 43135]